MKITIQGELLQWKRRALKAENNLHSKESLIDHLFRKVEDKEGIIKIYKRASVQFETNTTPDGGEDNNEQS